MLDADVVNVGVMLRTLVESLVDQPEHVRFETVVGDAGVTFRIDAHPSDLGKLIGVSGRTARAIRVLLAANAARLKRSFSLDLGASDRALHLS